MSTAAFYMRDGLTLQEVIILRHIATGKPNKVIAGEVWLTEQTVKFHASNIMRKLGVLNRTAAVWRALEFGLIDAPGADPVPACPTCGQRLAAPPAGYTQ